MSDDLKIIHIPDLPDWQKFPPPAVPASRYRSGTIVEDARSVQWEVYWDEQDHQLEWRKHAEAKHVRVGPGECSCGFDAYQVRGIMLDYGDLLASHLRAHR